MDIPYEYYNGKLGIKVKFLIIDDDKRHERSLCLFKYRALKKRIDSANRSEKELRRACFGQEALILFTSLDRDTKDRITLRFGKTQEEVKKSFFAEHYVSDREAADFYLRHTYGDDDMKLEPRYVELYTYNASVLNTVILMRTNRKEYIRAIGATQIDLWDSLSRDVNSFRDVAHNLPTHKHSLRRKVTQYVKEGYGCLISKKHVVKNAVKVSSDEQTAFLEKILRQPQNLNNEQAADLYNMLASKLDGWKKISAGAVANYRKKLELYVSAGNAGITNFRNTKTMQVKRSAPTVPMIYWTVDGNVTELLYQRQSRNKKGHLVPTYHHRLTTVVVLDPFNNYIIGYAIGENESPALIKEALRNAVNHTKELFGERYKTAQMQSDRYQIKNLTPLYSAMSKVSIPTRVHNAKGKVIEPFFDKFNEKHFQAKLQPNWSGHNVNSKKTNQPNGEHLNKIRHSFPDEQGCRTQIIRAIETDRQEKIDAYLKGWNMLPSEDRLPLSTTDYLNYFGEHTGYTNKLQGQGITPTLLGETRYFDSFDIKFRKHAHVDWLLKYDPEDLTQVLAVNAKSRDGRLIEEIGTMRFVLENKHIQPMALYDRKEGDSDALQKIFDYNKQLEQHVTDKNCETDAILIELRNKNSELDILTKFQLADGKGQHKEQKQKAQDDTEIIKIEVEKLPEDYEDYEIIEDIRSNY